ncbi:MAG: alcohol dehydrogenase [Euryarchaeota archaeon]|nr:alcohol dehydrogenase [Euryarchaeota archaeon]
MERESMTSGVRVIIKKAGGVSAITTEPMQPPAPKEGEVRIKVAYAGINFADLLMRLGFYQPRPPYPFTPGYEVSGVVDALGKDVQGLEVGQKVVAAMRNGGQASFIVSPVERVLPLPEGISLQAAASTPVTYMTAHHMLHHLGHLRPEDKVLIHGGAGGVGTAALQLCKWAGVTQVWATSSKGKHAVLEAYGARPIDRHHEDFEAIIKRETDGKGVDHILDPIGGDHLRRSLSCLAEGGRLYTYGMSSAAPSGKRSLLKALFALRRTPKFDALRLMTRNRSVVGVHMGTWSNESVMHGQLARIVEGIQAGHLEPIVDCVFEATEIQQAHQYIHEAKNTGKVLLRFHDLDD